MKVYKTILAFVFTCLILGVITTSANAANWSTLVTSTSVAGGGSGKTSSNYVTKKVSAPRGAVKGYEVMQWLKPKAGIVNSNGISRSNTAQLDSNVEREINLSEDAWINYNYYGRAYSHNLEPNTNTIKYYFTPDPA